MSDFEQDPEVVADLRLRAATEHDRSRSRTANYAWKRPDVVGQWRCRNPQCKAFVDVTEEAMDALCTFNAQLRKQLQAPLDVNQILVCDACTAILRDGSPSRLRKRVDKMAEAIRELKQSGDPTRERDLLKKLEDWGHPDVNGLVQAIVDRRVADSGRVGKKRTL